MKWNPQFLRKKCHILCLWRNSPFIPLRLLRTTPQSTYACGLQLKKEGDFHFLEATIFPFLPTINWYQRRIGMLSFIQRASYPRLRRGFLAQSRDSVDSKGPPKVVWAFYIALLSRASLASAYALVVILLMGWRTKYISRDAWNAYRRIVAMTWVSPLYAILRKGIDDNGKHGIWSSYREWPHW